VDNPHVEGAIFVGDRVLRWERLTTRPAARQHCYGGSSGDPLSLPVLGAPADLGLIAEAELSPILQERLAEAVIAVIVSLWDAEAFVAVLPPGLSN
jgi:hypothetical protein